MLCKKISWNSVRVKIICGVLTVFIPLILFLIFNNYYAINVIQNQVAQSNKNMITLYMRQLENSLLGTAKYLYNISGLNKDFLTMVYSNDYNNYTLAKISLRNKISKDILMFEMVNSIFIYSEKKDDLVEVYNSKINYQQKVHVRDYIKQTLPGVDYKYRDDWYIEKIEGENYLFHIMKIEDTYIGLWLNIRELNIPMNLVDLGEEGTTLLADKQGIPMINQEIVIRNKIDLNKNINDYYLSGEKEKFLVISKRSSLAEFSLIALIPSKIILESLSYLQKVIGFIVIGSLLLLPICFYFLRRVLLHPLGKIDQSIRQVQYGDLDVRIADFPTSNEFRRIFQTFNEMMDEIKQLRINIYEEKLEKQRAELKHLQLQVNPHFFLNSLNIVYSLAQSKNYSLIKEISRSLVQYFRFMFRSNISFVLLSEELNHVKNYIKIHQLRFPGRLECNIDIENRLLDIPVPPLIVQTFVENSIKHGLSIENSLLININVYTEIINKDEYTKIIIKDNGPGFNDDILEDLKTGSVIIKEDREHVGIWNIRKRLDILYDKYIFKINNRTEYGGAVISILLLKDSDKI
ncbi:sensor histidine kinase [Natronospora cellulosivora (SeqCode)]